MRRGELAYQQLREMLIDHRYPPGAPLPEQALCDELGISRTPVREALQRLASEQLVRILPGRGAFVAEISVPDMIELYQLREALEPYASALAARAEPTPELKEVLGQIPWARSAIRDGRVGEYYAFIARIDAAVTAQAGNNRLATELGLVWAQIRRHRRVAAASVERLLDSVDEHEAILTRIVDRDEEGAAGATRQHVRNSLAHVMGSVTGTR